MNHQSLDEDKGEHVDEMDSKDTTKNKLASNNISQKLMQSESRVFTYNIPLLTTR